MNLKRYRVNNIQEALQQIKRDLGPEAVIVSTRQVKEGKGAFGLFGKTLLEVTATREEKKPNAGGTPALPGFVVQNSETSPVNAGHKTKEYSTLEKRAVETAGASHLRDTRDFQTILLPLQKEIHEMKELVEAIKVRTATYGDHAINQLKHELGEMRHMLHMIVSQSNLQEEMHLPENLMIMYQQMKFSGLEEKFSKRVVMEAQKNISEQDLKNFTYVKIFLARMLMKIIKTTNGIENIDTSQKIVSLIGPTGVGKTTTAAKIASEQMQRHQRKVALITVDTFRIAAVEQLRAYAKVINVPLSIVTDKTELDRAITSYADYEVIIIDTGGCSQRDETQMFELREIFDERGRLYNILVLSASTKDSDANEITRKFGSMPLDSIIFTKLDESSFYGSIFNHTIRFKKPVSYLTTGQNVPEDIEAATKERLVDLLLHISGT